MKRTCLQKNTIEYQCKLNTNEQNTCEFHPDENSFNELPFNPKDIQHVKSFVQMKRTCCLFNSKGGSTKGHENKVHSGNRVACEFHENALIFNNLTPLFSHETSMLLINSKRRQHKRV